MKILSTFHLAYFVVSSVEKCLQRRPPTIGGVAHEPQFCSEGTVLKQFIKYTTTFRKTVADTVFCIGGMRCFIGSIDRVDTELIFVNHFMEIVMRQDDKTHYIFMAPYISEQSARAMKEEKCSYMDLSGNCYILTKRFLLYVSGQDNKFITHREKKNYLSKSSSAASAIIRTMLNEPERKWQVKTLAQESNTALGTVSNVKSFLLARDWIDKSTTEFRLQNIRELFYTWAKDYHQKEARKLQFYSLDTVPEIEQSAAEWSKTHDNGAILGGFSAAARYAPTVRYQKAEIYVEPQFVQEFVKDLELQPVNTGGNVVITIPHDETPCMYAKPVHDTLVTSPAQTVIDLLGDAGRGEEAAEAILRREYPERTDDERRTEKGN